MTDTNNKIRSIVLAALMVFSVFAGSIAFAGTAAAVDGVTSGGTTLADNPNEGTSATGDITVNLSNINQSTGEVKVDLGVTNASFTSVGSATVSGGSSVKNGSASVSNGNITVNLSAAVSDDVTVKFSSAQVKYNGPGFTSDQSANFGAWVTEADGNSSSNATLFSKTIVAQDKTTGSNVVLTSPSAKPLVWAGQTVGTAEFNDDVDVQLRRNTSDSSSLVVQQKNTSTDGYVEFKTAGRPTGDYFLTTGNGSTYKFELATQEISADFAADTVDNGGSATTVDFEAESNRASYEHVLEATYEGDAVAASDLQDILGGAGTVKDADDDDTDELVVAGTSDDTFSANFSGADAGNYTVTTTVNDTGVSDSATVEVIDVSSGEADFNTSTIQVSEGGIASIDVELSGAATKGTLVIGDEESDGYQANVSFTDGDSDGEVTVMFNTYAAGSMNNGTVVWAAGSDDSVSFNNSTDQTMISAMLAQGDYTLAVSASSTAAATKDEPQDLGALVIGERSTDSIKLWTAPSGTTFDADGEDGVTESDIGSLVEDGMVTEASGTITAGDYMVHQVSATGLDGVIEAEGGLSDALGSDAVMLSIVQTNPVQNSDPKEVNVSASTLTLVEGDGSYYIVAKTSGLVLEDTPKEIKAGSEFKATFTVANDRLLRSDDAEDRQSVNTTFEVVAPETTLDNDPVQVQAASGQTITGASNYAPGTELTVRVRSGSDVTPGFFNTQTVMVQADGTFNASFDFSEQATGDTFAVTVRKGGTTLPSADGEVVDAQTATATATTTATATATATATEAATDMPTDTAAATDEPDTDTETTSEETPGFGVAVALVALLAAALLAGRRE